MDVYVYTSMIYTKDHVSFISYLTNNYSCLETIYSILEESELFPEIAYKNRNTVNAPPTTP